MDDQTINYKFINIINKNIFIIRKISLNLGFDNLLIDRL